MQTGSLIAIVIAVLVLLAIWWFMTRAGRARAAQRYEQDSAALSDGASAAERGAPDGRSGPIVTESMGAGSVAVAAAGPATEAADAAGDGDNTFAGVQGSSLDGANAGANAGAGAGAGADVSNVADRDKHGHPGAGSGTAPMVPPAAEPATTFERPRFDPTIDGHPSPGDAPASDSAPSSTPAPASASASATATATASATATPEPGALPSAQPALTGDCSVDSGDPLVDVREMIKILNLRDADAGRLGLEHEQFEALRHARRDGIDDETLTAVAERLRHMLR